MNEEKHYPLTFAILDRQKGISELPPATTEEYPLPAWYRAVWEIPIDELSVEDICKACRQQFHLDHVVPRALEIMKSDPLAGNLYDGELLVSLKSVPPDYWPDRRQESRILKAILERTLLLDTVTDDVRQDVKELLSQVAPEQ